MIEFSYKVILDDTGRIIPEEFLKGVHLPLSELEKTLIVAICEDSNKHLINSKIVFCNSWVSMDVIHAIVDALIMGVIGTNDPSYNVVIDGRQIHIANPDMGKSQGSIILYLKLKGVKESCFSCSNLIYEENQGAITGYCRKQNDAIINRLIAPPCDLFEKLPWGAIVERSW